MSAPLLPRSSRTGIGWPAIPSYRDAAALALARQLEDSEWWSADRLLAHQLRQLEFVLAHAWTTVPFYRGRLRVLAGLKRGELTLEAWRRIPVLLRTEVQKAGDALVSAQIPEDHRPPHEHSTSGSTGRPVVILSTPVTGLFFAALHLRYHRWHKRDLGAKLAKLTPLKPEQEALARTGKALPWVSIYGSGRMFLLNSRTPVSEQLRWLIEKRPDYLLTQPSNLRELLRRSVEIDLRPNGLREVATLSEIVDPSLRSTCEEIWGAKLVDCYSCEEFGLVALQCPDHPHYHVQSESVLVEVLDDRDRPCRAGEIGRLVITDLHNLAKPLIRYANGDFAEVGEKCPCGRGLPVLARIVGRVRNMLTLPSGDKMWPTFHADYFLAVAPIRQFQLVQHSLGDVEVKLVVDQPLTARQETALRANLVERLGHSFAIRFTYRDEIPHSPGGKFEDFISLIPEDRG